jgi:GTP-binding protein
MKIRSAEFLTTATAPAGWPSPDVPEFAFAGRSNVGKSSMINALVSRKSLVRVSNTPGRTRTLNFFDVTAEEESGARHRIRFCDLPGYGFAKVSQAEREQWKRMIEEYLAGRQTLRGVVSIVDAEVGPTPLDEELLAWVRAIPLDVVVVATKVDRLGKARRKPRLAEVAKKMDLPPASVLGFSAVERIGIDAVWSRLISLAGVSETGVPVGATGEPR